MDASSPDSNLLTLNQIRAMLAARRALVAWVTLGIVFATLVVVLVMPRVWTSTADIVIDYKENDPITGRSFSALLDDSYMQTQIDLIKSQAVAERMLRTLGLLPPRTDTGGARTNEYDELVESIGRNLEVNSQRSSRVLSVSFSAETPQKARDYANAIVNAYIQVSQELATSGARARTEQYNAQLEQMRKEIEAIQAKLTQYQQETGIIDAQQADNLESRRLNDLMEALLAVQTQLQEAQARTQAIDRLLAAGVRPEDLPQVGQVIAINDMREGLTMLNRQLGEVQGALGANHPTIRGLTAERQQLRADIARQARAAIEVQRGEPLRLQAQMDALQGEIDAQRAKVLERMRQRDQVVAYQRQLAGVEQVYNTALQKYDGLLMASNITSPNLSVLRPAELPTLPARPRKTQSMVMGLVVGLAIGLMLALLLELSVRRVRSPDDLRLGDAPMIGRVGYAADGRA